MWVKNMKKLILFLSIISASGLVMITIYNLLVDANSWGSKLPSSILTARDYYRQVDPRNFFQIMAPINQLLILLTFSFVARLFLDRIFALCNYCCSDFYLFCAP